MKYECPAISELQIHSVWKQTADSGIAWGLGIHQLADPEQKLPNRAEFRDGSSGAVGRNVAAGD
jgi:hypothetical protein